MKKLTEKEKFVLLKESKIEKEFGTATGFAKQLDNIINSPYLNDKDFSLDRYIENKLKKNQNVVLMTFIKDLKDNKYSLEEIKNILRFWKIRILEYEWQGSCDHLPSLKGEDILYEIDKDIFMCQKCGKVINISIPSPEDINKIVEDFTNVYSNYRPHLESGESIETILPLSSIRNRLTDKQITELQKDKIRNNVIKFTTPLSDQELNLLKFKNKK